MNQLTNIPQEVIDNFPQEMKFLYKSTLRTLEQITLLSWDYLSFFRAYKLYTPAAILYTNNLNKPDTKQSSLKGTLS